MNKQTVKSKDIEIGKRKFNCSKNLFLLEDVNNDIIFISNKVSFGKSCFKYFIGSKDNDKKIKPLFLFFKRERI